jgi:hypothetical protein
MTGCAICDHAKHASIDAALASGRAPKLVRHQYALDWQRLQAHLAHQATTAADSMPREVSAAARNPLSDKVLRVLDLVQQTHTVEPFNAADYEQQFREAWQGMDPPARQRMVFWLNEQFHPDE